MVEPADETQTKKRRPSARIPARRSIRYLRNARRISQGLFLSLFLFLLCGTAFRGSFSSGTSAISLPWPVEAFLLADPFVALMTLLSTHAVYRGLLWAVAIVGITLVFGRVFCGWICPFGTIHHVLGWILPSRKGRGFLRIKANQTHAPRQRVKYYLLYASLAAALAGSAFGGVLDPICMSVRAIGLAILPAAQYTSARAFGPLANAESRMVQGGADVVQDVLAQTFWQTQQFYYHQAWFIGLVVVGLFVMNRFIPRFWCRVLCPLGALLGLTSRFALFGMHKDNSKCTDCNLCLLHCQGADSPQGGAKWRQDECHMCLNCETACPEDVIKFGFLPGRETSTQVPDTQKRTTLAALAAGAALVPAARISGGTTSTNHNPRMIRPPGSVDEAGFLDRCIRCGECMKVCPNNALHPAWFEGGLEGLWTPILIPRVGYCEPSCVLCGQVCPTGAIEKITQQQKLGTDGPPIKLGTAFYDHGRCLPWAMQTPCIVCEEFCPTSPKAIWLEPVETVVRDSKPGDDHAPPAMLNVKLQRPHVDPALCIGCGACEKVCPVQDQPAIYVTSIGESRSNTNVILLREADTKRSAT